jgi:hypothetical protein
MLSIDCGWQKAFRKKRSRISNCNEEDAQKALEIMQKCLAVSEKFYQFYHPPSSPESEPKKNLE